jgi:hypothetical protein
MTRLSTIFWPLNEWMGNYHEHDQSKQRTSRGARVFKKSVTVEHGLQIIQHGTGEFHLYSSPSSVFIRSLHCKLQQPPLVRRFGQNDC